MKRNLFLIILYSSILLFSCSKTSHNSNQKQSLVSLLASSNAGCSKSNVNSIGGATRTLYIVKSCQPSDLATLGLTGQNLSQGLTGSGTSSILQGPVIASQVANLEVSFTVNDSSGYLDAIGFSYNTTGPAFRLQPGGIVAVDSSGGVSSSSSGVLPTVSQGQLATFCLEFSVSGGILLGGWGSPCATLTATERSAYQFQFSNVGGVSPGKQSGFVLNKASIQQFITTAGGVLNSSP